MSMEVILEEIWEAKVSMTAFIVGHLRVTAIGRIGHHRPRLGDKSSS